MKLPNNILVAKTPWNHPKTGFSQSLGDIPVWKQRLRLVWVRVGVERWDYLFNLNNLLGVRLSIILYESLGFYPCFGGLLEERLPCCRKCDEKQQLQRTRFWYIWFLVQTKVFLLDLSEFFRNTTLRSQFTTNKLERYHYYYHVLVTYEWKIVKKAAPTCCYGESRTKSKGIQKYYHPSDSRAWGWRNW